MKYLTIIILAIATVQAGAVRGDLIFSFVPASTQIQLGSSVDIEIFIQARNDVAVTVGGYSLNVNAGPGDGTAGRFTAGTFDFLVGDPGQAWDLSSTPGQAFSTADTANGTMTGMSLSTSRRLGVLTLSTTGANAGNYSFSVNQLSAIQTNGFFISGGVNGATFAGPVAYTITAVPEPGSLLLLSSLGTAAGCWIRLRRTKSQVRGLSRVDSR